MTFRSTRDKEILRALRDRKQIIPQTERQENNDFKIVREKYILHRILDPAKISFSIMKAE